MKKRPIILLAFLLCLSTTSVKPDIIQDMVEEGSHLWNELHKYIGYVDHYKSTLPELNGVINVFNKTMIETNNNLEHNIKTNLNQIQAKAKGINDASILFQDANALAATPNPIATMKEVQNSINHICSMITYIQSMLDNFKAIAGTVNHIIHSHANPTWGWSATVSYAGEFMKKIDRPDEVKNIADIGTTVSNIGQQLSSNSMQYYLKVESMIPKAQKTLDHLKVQLSTLVNKMNGPLQQLHGLAGGQS